MLQNNIAKHFLEYALLPHNDPEMIATVASQEDLQ
jgi:hypothetical protein